MHLRELTSDDLDTIHAINEGAVPAVGTETRSKLAHIAAESTIALVAEEGATIAGFCMVLTPGADYPSMNYRWFTARYADFVYLDRVAIAPEFHRRGIGLMMYDEV